MSSPAASPQVDENTARFVRVEPADREAVTAAVELLNAAQAVDDPDAWPDVPELAARWLEFGWDLHPDERYLYYPDGSDSPVGVLDVDLPVRDNLHLVWSALTVHPEHRRQGHGSAMMAELLRRTEEAGRTTVWLGGIENEPASKAFLEKFGFHYASHDARRRQVVADVDQAAVGVLLDKARTAASDYVLERYLPPIADEVLSDLIEVTEAINDAPMGDLTYEDEKFDLQRLQDIETARSGRGDRVYRMAARHRETGQLGGHTLVVVNPLRARLASQGDTAVHRDHRGHRLGLLLKVEMMRWLAEAEPQIEVIETWNNADNSFMINVNEAIGYRLSQVFAVYERNLGD